MHSPTRILILTADYGFGHRSAANAILAAVQETLGDRCFAEVINPLDNERTPAFLRDGQEDYDKMVRRMPELYKLEYEVTDTALPSAIIDRALTVLLFNGLQDLLKHWKPDVVIVTNPLFPAALNAVITLNKLPIPFLTVITDLTSVHRQWFETGSDYLLVPTQEVAGEAAASGFIPEQIQVTGIPVHPNLKRENRPPEAVRADLGWQPDLVTALVVGSKRVKGLYEVLNVLNHSGLPLQLVIAAGGDEELYNRLKEIEWHRVTHVYNFVDQMPRFMHASDLIICKAGGLITTEALACGLPILFMDLTPGQEEGNASYVVKNGAGELAADPVTALEVLCHWLDADQALLRQRAERSCALGRPQAAYLIAELAQMSAERGRVTPPSVTTQVRARLQKLLKRFDITNYLADGTES